MNKKNFEKLPEKILVTVIKRDGGCYVIKLPELDAFTEADTIEDLPFMLNDLIYTYFDIPEELHGKIWYMSTDKKSPLLEVNQVKSFNMLITPEVSRSYFS